MNPPISFHSKFEPEKLYHVIAKSVDGIDLFLNDENKIFFLKRYAHYIPGFADTYAYCLMDNHVHWLVAPRTAEVIEEYLKSLDDAELSGTQKKFLQNAEGFDFNELIETQFNYLFVSYVRSFNKVYNRKGGMFNKPFRCLEVQDEFHLTQLIVYIHANPLKHGLMKDFTKYKWSSYQSLISDKPTLLKRKNVLDLFGGKPRFVEIHRDMSQYFYDNSLGGE